MVSKLNKSYEVITDTPEGSNVGVNVNMDRFFEAMENGTDYEQMKEKLTMEVVSIEANKEMLEKVPHKEMEDMAVVYRFVINDNPGAKSQGMKQLMAGGGVALIGTTLVPLLSGLF